MFEIRQGDALEVLRTLPDGAVRCCVTSPPYWGLRDYGHEGQLGLERTPEEYVEKLVEVFREVRRVLADDGTLWCNLGDSYAGSWGAQSRQGETGQMVGRSIVDARAAAISARQIAAHPKTTKTGSMERTPGLKPKDLVGIPWRVAFALQADGADTKTLAVLDAACSAIVDAYDGESLPDKALAALERLRAEYAGAKGASWYLRSDIIWSKPNPMPESVTDRPTKAHEYLFLLSKSQRYYYDAEAIAEPATYAGKVVTLGEKSLSRGQAAGANVKASGNALADAVTVAALRNRRSVWTVTTQPFPGAHFAVMPQALVEPCILAGSEPGDTVLDPFAGSGTVGVVALRHGRRFVGVELSPEYVRMAQKRIRGPLFSEAAP